MGNLWLFYPKGSRLILLLTKVVSTTPGCFLSNHVLMRRNSYLLLFRAVTYGIVVSSCPFLLFSVEASAKSQQIFAALPQKFYLKFDCFFPDHDTNTSLFSLDVEALV